MDNHLQKARGFGRYDIGTSSLYAPSTVDGVNEVFEIAARSHGRQRIAIRAGGHSFCGQALHRGDEGSQLVLSTSAFDPDRIEFDLEAPDTVTLGSGVAWRNFVQASIARARERQQPIRIPGSLQTGGDATVGGTLSGDCLSRFSGRLGKESAWIHSFRILTPAAGQPVYASRTENPDLFHAAIGGHGYLGFVTEATYRLIPLPDRACAHTRITTFRSFSDLVRRQVDLVQEGRSPRAVSSAWYTAPLVIERRSDASRIRGAIFDSVYEAPRGRPHFPLYHNLFSLVRYLAEVAARHAFWDWLIHKYLDLLVTLVHDFEDDLEEFLFFMDGDTAARKQFERRNKRPFPIVQQTFVLPAAATAKFAIESMQKIAGRGLHPSECDMLFVAGDEALMSANYRLDGFAVSFGFEPADSDCAPAPELVSVLRDLSVDCHTAGGRIHLPKNSHIAPEVFRPMFSPQIQRFEEIKRRNDPGLLLQNPFSDTFFRFAARSAAQAEARGTVEPPA